MMIKEKNRHSETKPFISLSRKAFFFWSGLITALFAVFFLAGTLTGRGQIKVDLGQYDLFNEISDMDKSAEEKTEASPAVEPSPDETTDFAFYNSLVSKKTSSDLAVTPAPSTKKKTKQIIKKNLKVISPEELDKPDKTAASPVFPPPAPIAKEKQQPEKTTASTPVKKETEKISSTPAEKPKTQAVQADKNIEKKPEEKATQTETKNRYSIQVAALRNSADAEEMVKKLKEMGFSAYTVKSGDAATLFKVRVGSYSNRADAEKTKVKLKEKNFDSFVAVQ